MSRFNALARAAAAPAPAVDNAPATNVIPLPGAQPQPTSAKPGALKKISFGKAPRKADTKTEYPIYTHPDPAVLKHVLATAAEIKSKQDELDALEGIIKASKLELKLHILPFYFNVNRDRPVVPSSVSIPSEEGEVLVTYQDRYAKLESEDPLIPILGEHTGDYFRQAFQLTVKGEALPADRAQDIVNEIQEVLERHNAMDALDVKEEIKPVKDFHTIRHARFTPEQNIQIDNICPITAMVKTKGRGSK